MKHPLVKVGALTTSSALHEDVIIALAQELERLDPQAAHHFREHHLGSRRFFTFKSMLSALTDILDEHAGEDLYFGAHPDYYGRWGFWPVELLRREAVPA